MALIYQKILIADNLAIYSDSVFNAVNNGVNPDLIKLGSVCYSFQLYFDFSGYCDMAIGILMLNIKLAVNLIVYKSEAL